MKDFHEIISKKVWFLLFNVGTIAYLILWVHIQLNAISLVCYGLALLLINGVALISGRRYKGKFKGW